MEKSFAKYVFEHFDCSIQTLDKAKLLEVFSDGPNVNLAFFELLKESRREAELNELLDIGTCGLHILHKASNWIVKKTSERNEQNFPRKPLGASKMQANFEKLTSSTKADFPLHFFFTRLTENAIVAKKAQEV